MDAKNSRAAHQKGPSDESTGRADAKLWWEVLAVFTIVPLPFLWLRVTQLVVPATQPAQADPMPYWFSLLARCFYFVCYIYLTMYVIYRSGEPWAKFGLGWPRWQSLWLGLLLFVGVELLDGIRRALFPAEPYGGLGGPLQDSQRVINLVLLPVTVLLGGFVEELVFRSYLVTRLETLMKSATWAVVCSALLFGVVHAGVATMAQTALVGLLYGALYLKVRQIWPFVLGHALHNGFVLVRGATY